MRSPNELRFSGAAPIDGCHIVAETDAEKRPISLDAQRRPLQARVGRQAISLRSLSLSAYPAFIAIASASIGSVAIAKANFLNRFQAPCLG